MHHLKRTILTAFALSLLLFSCKEEVKPEAIALQSAKEYYDQLLKGDYDSYVNGTLQGDSVPSSYRNQLLLNMQMFIEQQKKEHQGIDSVTPIRAVVDTASHTANAFLTLHFSDKTQENIVVPMIEKNNIWYLR